jgi:hypothetical protein
MMGRESFWLVCMFTLVQLSLQPQFRVDGFVCSTHPLIPILDEVALYEPLAVAVSLNEDYRE